MVKSSTSGTTAPAEMTLVSPQPMPVVVLADQDKLRRATLEKELQGIRAKLKWTHLSEGVLAELRIRAGLIEKELRG